MNTENAMRYPDFLKPNGKIGFVAPSFGCATEPYISYFDNAQRILRNKGYGLTLGPNCYVEKGIGISNTPDKCGAELNEMYSGSECDVIISCGGGEMMCEVVPYIDFDLIGKRRPKWYMGYSDNTNFTFLSATLSDTAAIYGPCAAAFGMEPWHKAIQDALSVITGTGLNDDSFTFNGYDRWEYRNNKEDAMPFAPYNTTEASRIISLTNGVIGDYEENVGLSWTGHDEEPIVIRRPVSTGDITMSGRLIGGCLDCLVHLVGTPYDRVSEFADRYASDGILWFLEACDLNPMDIRRSMWQLKEAGWFKNVSGFMIGRTGKFGEEIMGLDNYRAVVDIISQYGVPVLLDADIGHHPPMLPVICGSYTTVTTSGNNYSVAMRLS